MRRWLFRHRWPLAGALILAGLLAAASTILAQPPVPHAAMPGEDCLSCHQTGVAGAPRVAWDHLGRSNEDCAHCHRISEAPAGEIPHPVAGRENCLSCHREGTGEAPKLIANHVDYANDECRQCHHLSAAAEEATPIPTPAPTPETAPPPSAGTGNCASCHQLIFADEEHQAFTGQPLGDSERGADLFAQLCVDCHGENGKEPVGEQDAVINSKGYWSTHDDAVILRDIGMGSHGQMTAFAQEYGGPLSWEQILDLAAFVRSWGALTTTATPAGGEITYESTVGPLLTERCSECHGGIAGLTVTDYESLMAGSDSGPVVVPGDPDASLIVEVQRGEHYAHLSAAELDRLIEWIAAGAPEQ